MASSPSLSARPRATLPRSPGVYEMSQTTPPADDRPDAARGETTPQDEARPAPEAAPSVTPPLPFYRRPLFWSLLFLVLLLALLGWHIYRQWQTARELEARQQAELAAVRERNDALEAYLKMLRELLAQVPEVFFRAIELFAVHLDLRKVFVNALEKPVRSSRRILFKLDKALDALELHAVGAAR